LKAVARAHQSGNLPPLKRTVPFVAGMIYELAFLSFALFWGLAFHRAPLADVHWDLKNAGEGAAAAVPPFLFLGLLWIWTGNLLTPIITHAVYDLAALVYFLRVYRSRS